MMRHLTIVLGFVGLWGMAPAREAVAAPKWQYPAHSYYNVAPDYMYRMRLYVQVGAQIVQWPDEDTFHDYTGPTYIPGSWTIPEMWRWDRNAHQIDFGGLGITPDAVWGEVENQYLGSGPWYHIDTINYEEN